MPTFGHISGAEPSTVTFKLATVSQTRNSSVMHQEIMALGDPDSSNAIAAVLNTVPASTAWALAVRQVGNSSIQGNSTVFQGTSPWVVSGASTVAPVTGSTWNTRPIQSSAADLQMTATQGTSPWVVSGASTVAQASTVWAVQMSQYSTTVQVSSVAGRVATAPNSTAWASSAGFHFDSSGALQIAGAITATAGSTVSTGFIAVRLSDGSTWIADYLQGSTFTSTSVAGGVGFLRSGASSVSSSDTFVMPWGSTQGAQYFIPVTDSGVSVMDSTNRAINVNVVAGSAAGSTVVSISSLGTRVFQSTAADLQATVTQASTVWAVQLTQWSTTCNVSSVGGIVQIQGNSTAVIQGNSTAFQGGTWTVNVGTHIQSSVAPSSGSSGLIVRQVIDGITTFASTSALASTTVSVVSSAASIRAYVTAYSITSTNQTAAHWGFFSGATLLWPITLAALSSGVAGANLAVSAPGYLFRTSAAEALNFKTAGSTVAGVQLGVSYYLAP
jgi:hypothetical protein